MHWIKMKIHLKHWANSLEEEGYYADAKYVMEELMVKIDNDLPIYNERGKQKILELVDGLDDVTENCWCGLVVLVVLVFMNLRFYHRFIAPLSASH